MRIDGFISVWILYMVVVEMNADEIDADLELDIRERTGLDNVDELVDGIPVEYIGQHRITAVPCVIRGAVGTEWYCIDCETVCAAGESGRMDLCADPCPSNPGRDRRGV